MKGWKLLYVMSASIDGSPKLSDRLKGQFKMWDELAIDVYQKVYDKLTGGQKLRLHETYDWAGNRRPEPRS